LAQRNDIPYGSVAIFVMTVALTPATPPVIVPRVIPAFMAIVTLTGPEKTKPAKEHAKAHQELTHHAPVKPSMRRRGRRMMLCFHGTGHGTSYKKTTTLGK
jgi:hypothetical protein